METLLRAAVTRPWLTLLMSALVLLLGARALWTLPLDLFPELTQPTVTLLGEAPGRVPESVESEVTIPLERALLGVEGLETLRSTSGDGLATLRMQMAWGTDPYRARQLVLERTQLVDLPEDVHAELAPLESLTGEVLHLGLVGDADPDALHTYGTWTLRPHLMSVPGVAQVVMVGGQSRQIQVLADPDRLYRQRLDLGALADGVAALSHNGSGGYAVVGHQELPVRFFGRLERIEQLGQAVFATVGGRPVRVSDVATVREGAEYPRGSAAIDGQAGVLFLIFKQPGANTLDLTERVDAAVQQLIPTLPEKMELKTDLFRQATFLQRGVDNVRDAVRDGALLVALVLWLFLRSRSASFITLTAIPLSLATTALVLDALGMSLNTMTLGGLALAVGELVDDAIVGVENTLRRLRTSDADFLETIVSATAEVRGPLLTGTALVVVVFLPLFALEGLEGRLFTPLAVSYAVALLTSLAVSLTTAPALAALFFRRHRPEMGRSGAAVERWSGQLIRKSLGNQGKVLLIGGFLHLAGIATVLRADTELLPSFDEGTVLVMTFGAPGTSLEAAAEMADTLAKSLAELPGVTHVSRYTGRGEHDEHAPPSSVSHLLLTLDPEEIRDRDALLAAARARAALIPGLSASVGQPLAHRMDHLMSGVQAQLAVKVVGPELEVLRERAEHVATALKAVPGTTDVQVEPEVLAPQIHVRPHLARLAAVGLSPGGLAREGSRAVGGEVVGEWYEGTRSFDLAVRLERAPRASVEALRALPFALPGGGLARLGDLARVEVSNGPLAISRDNGVRRVAVQANVQGRSVGAAAAEIEQKMRELEQEFPPGYHLEVHGTFQSQRRATLALVGLSAVALVGAIGLLSMRLRSLTLGALVFASVPSAWIGGAFALSLSGQPISVPALVGFVSLTGLASRNGLLLLTRALQRAGGGLSAEVLIRSGAERALPIAMTGLTTGVGLAPLLWGGESAGRELLYPVATVVVGGLLTSGIAELTLRPVLLLLFGRGAAEKVLASGLDSAILGENVETP